MTLQVDGLALGYRHLPVLIDVNLAIAPGRHFLVGANGTGKSTLLQALAGVLSPRAGHILWGEENLRSIAVRRKYFSRSGYVTQSSDLPPGFTCGDFLEYCAWLKGVTHLAQAADRALRTINLEQERQRSVKKLSGGMRRRLMLAAELVHEPDVLLLDEPTTGVDTDNRRAIYAALDDPAYRSATVVMATHQQEDLVALGGHVHVLAGGKLSFTVRQARDETLNPALSDLW